MDSDELHGEAVEFSVEGLLYSELTGNDLIVDGMNYGMVANRNEFNRTWNNLYFEYSRNSESKRINLVMTDFVSEHCQR